MRVRDAYIIWVNYIDSSKTRKEGRKVPKSLAIIKPKLSELASAAEELNVLIDIKEGSAHPRTHWEKSGYIIVKKTGRKLALIKELCELIRKKRSRKL